MEPSGRFFIQRKTLLWSTFKKYFYMEKDTFVKKVSFFVPGYRYADKGEGGKIMKKDTVGKCCFYSGQRVCL